MRLVVSKMVMWKHDCKKPEVYFCHLRNRMWRWEVFLQKVENPGFRSDRKVQYPWKKMKIIRRMGTLWLRWKTFLMATLLRKKTKRIMQKFKKKRQRNKIRKLLMRKKRKQLLSDTKSHSNSNLWNFGSISRKRDAGKIVMRTWLSQIPRFPCLLLMTDKGDHRYYFEVLLPLQIQNSNNLF